MKKKKNLFISFSLATLSVNFLIYFIKAETYYEYNSKTLDILLIIHVYSNNYKGLS